MLPPTQPSKQRRGGAHSLMSHEKQTRIPPSPPRDQASRRVRSRSFVRWTLRHGTRIWAVAALLGAVGTWGTARLYAHLDDLNEIHRRVDERKRWEASKQFGSLLDEEPAPPIDFSDLRAKYEGRGLAASGAQAASARFSSAEKHLTLLLVEGGDFA